MVETMTLGQGKSAVMIHEGVVFQLVMVSL